MLTLEKQLTKPKDYCETQPDLVALCLLAKSCANHYQQLAKLIAFPSRGCHLSLTDGTCPRAYAQG